MFTILYFFLLIPLLAFILLSVNLLFAPNNPYQEKDSPFECGFHSFLGQNRTQFSISFFIFALLFLLFDLEILLVYPYIVSAYTNNIYGLVIMLIFFIILTLGFAFELGKKALFIENKQVISIPNRNELINYKSSNENFQLKSFNLSRALVYGSPYKYSFLFKKPLMGQFIIGTFDLFFRRYSYIPHKKKDKNYIWRLKYFFYNFDYGYFIFTVSTTVILVYISSFYTKYMYVEDLAILIFYPGIWYYFLTTYNKGCSYRSFGIIKLLKAICYGLLHIIPLTYVWVLLLHSPLFANVVLHSF